jgi:hypothetical protein
LARDKNVPVGLILKDRSMDVANLTKERIIALAIVVVQIGVAVIFSTVSRNWGIVAGSALLLSLPGLLMIWFREGLSVIGFDRGVLRDSPPLFIDALGWLFLIGLPVMFLYGLLP